VQEFLILILVDSDLAQEEDKIFEMDYGFGFNPIYVKHCLDFSFVFSAPLPAWKTLFSACLGHRSQISEGLVLRPFSYT
jgi:hypothetical protein